jgi:hypothetical protein
LDSDKEIVLPEHGLYTLAPALPFPSLSWWRAARSKETVLINREEHYRKRNYRNRYELAGPRGRQILSIPLKGGRDQKRPMKEVQICYDTDWQDNHWKTIRALYQRSPFFEYFAPDIQILFLEKTEGLCDWNLKSIQTINRLLDLKIKMTTTDQYQKDPPGHHPDLAKIMPLDKAQVNDYITYHQVFENRSGFLPDCSILDLLFCEGNHASLLLKP